jgi:hypothetical protein
MMVKLQTLPRTWILTCVLLLSIPAVTAAQMQLRQQVFEALGDQLQRPDLGRSHAFLDSLSNDTGLEVADLRLHLRELLDQLEAHRKSKSPAWMELTSPGHRRATPKKVDKLISELRKRSDRILKKKRDYSLSDLLSDAAKRADDMPDYRARAILLSAIGVNPDSVAVFTGLPERVGMMLRVRSFSAGGADVVKLSPQYGNPDLPATGVGAGTPLGRKAVTDPMAYYLRQEIEASNLVKWVMMAPTPRAEPDCALHFDILTFGTRWREFAPATPERDAQVVLNVSMQIQVDLYDYRLKNVVYSRFEEYHYDFPMEMDDETRPGLQFDKYYERVARDVSESVVAFLAE